MCMKHIEEFKGSIEQAIENLKKGKELDGFLTVYENAEEVIAAELTQRTSGHEFEEIISDIIDQMHNSVKVIKDIPENLGFPELVTQTLDKHTKAFNTESLSECLDGHDDGLEIYILNNANKLSTEDIGKSYLAGLLLFNFRLEDEEDETPVLSRFKKLLREVS